MAEATPPASVPAPDAAEAPVERAPDAQPSETPAGAEPATNAEQVTEKPNEPEEKPSDTAAAPQEQKEPQETQPEAPSAPAEPSDAKEPAAAEAPEAGAAAPAEGAPEPNANGTPASSKKSKNSKRRSSGIPEHKAKPGSKKKTRETHLHAHPGEYYLARLKSYPAWPSIVCDEEMLPETLLKSRPVTAMRPDGTYREDYADNGKRAHERTFPVMFFGTNEFAWIPNMDLQPTESEACKNVSEKGKNKSLLNAYSVASEGRDLQSCKAMLADHERAVQAEIETQEAKAAAKAEKQAKKSKRKSTDVDQDIEMEDVEEEEAPKPKKGSKKRKKEGETDGEASKPAKTPKTATKLKLTTPKGPAGEGETKSGGRSRRAVRSKKGAKAAVSEEEESEPEKEPEKPIDPEELKARREKEILYFRHKLQKGFISRDEPPKEEEMSTMASHFNKIESYTDLEVSIIRATKIHKVLRMIVKLNSIPRDEEFHFRQRAMDILSKWRNVLDSDPAGAAEEKEKDSKPAANGVQKEGSAETPTKLETEEEKEPEPKSSKEDTAQLSEEPMPDADVAEKAEAPEKEQAPEPAKEEPKEVAPAAEEGEGAGEKTVEKDAEAEKPEEKTEGRTEEKTEEKNEEKPVEAAA